MPQEELMQLRYQFEFKPNACMTMQTWERLYIISQIEDNRTLCSNKLLIKRWAYLSWEISEEIIREMKKSR